MGQSSCKNIIHPYVVSDSRIDIIERIVKEYTIFVQDIVAYQKEGKTFHLTWHICHTNSDYKARLNGLIGSFLEESSEELKSYYKIKFNKVYNSLIQALHSLQVQGNLTCDETILKNKYICDMLGIQNS